MKKPKLIPSKLQRKKKQPPVQEEAAAPRVTNDSVAHHRDEILSKAKKYKYPVHKSKHRIVLVSVAVVVGALVILSAFTGLQLYKWQNTSDFTYGVTSVLPFPVAKVDGKQVSYESYLFELRSTLHWAERRETTDLRSPDGQRQIEYWKRQALDKAMVNTLAKSFAKQHNITVSEAEVDETIERVKSVGGDLQTILSDEFNFGEGDFRRSRREAILRIKVAHQLDTDAPQRAQKVLSEIQGGKPFADAAKEYSEDLETKQVAGDIGVVEKGRAGLPEQVSEVLFKIEPGQVSDVITTNEDYFIVTVSERVDESKVKASIIRIKVKDINQYLKEYKEQNKVTEYIKFKDEEAEQ